MTPNKTPEEIADEIVTRGYTHSGITKAVLRVEIATAIRDAEERGRESTELERNTLLGHIGTNDMNIALKWIIEQHFPTPPATEPRETHCSLHGAGCHNPRRDCILATEQSAVSEKELDEKAAVASIEFHEYWNNYFVIAFKQGYRAAEAAQRERK